MSFQGKIREWNDARGFGFIEANDGQKRIFVHIKSFVGRQRRPLVNDIVTYRVKIDERGRYQAHNVSFYMKPPHFTYYFLKNSLCLLLVGLFFVLLGVSTAYRKLPFMASSYLILISGITFFAYSMDKAAAKDGEWRLSEDTLHFLSIAGGWPGALAAQVLLRHKSKKLSFRIVFWVTVAFNCLLLGFLFTDYGSSFLKNTLGLI